DNVPACNFEDVIGASFRDAAKQEWKLGVSRVLREGADATLIVYGALAEQALIAAEELASEGINVEVIDGRFCKPLDAAMLSRVLKNTRQQPVFTIEDHALQNGFGSAVIEHAVAHDLPTDQITRLGMPERLIAHATRKEQLGEVGLDAPGIAKSVRTAVKRVSVEVLRTSAPRSEAI